MSHERSCLVAGDHLALMRRLICRSVNTQDEEDDRELVRRLTFMAQSASALEDALEPLIACGLDQWTTLTCGVSEALALLRDLIRLSAEVPSVPMLQPLHAVVSRWVAKVLALDICHMPNVLMAKFIELLLDFQATSPPSHHSQRFLCATGPRVLSQLATLTLEASAAETAVAFVSFDGAFPALQLWLLLLSRTCLACLLDDADGTEGEKIFSEEVADRLPTRGQLLAVLAEQDDLMVDVLDAHLQIASLQSERGLLRRRFGEAVSDCVTCELHPALVFSDVMRSMGDDPLLLLDMLTSSGAVDPFVGIVSFVSNVYNCSVWWCRNVDARLPLALFAILGIRLGSESSDPSRPWATGTAHDGAHSSRHRDRASQSGRFVPVQPVATPQSPPSRRNALRARK